MAWADTFAHGATFNGSPEDLYIDRFFGEFVGDESIRWEWDTTCGVADGETFFPYENRAALNAFQTQNLNIGRSVGTIEFLSIAGTNMASVSVTRFVQNHQGMASRDNLDIQPHTINFYII